VTGASRKTWTRRHIADAVRPLTAVASRSPRLIVLMYHAVTRDDATDAAQLTVSRARFANQMRWLEELGYPVVSLAAAVRDLRARTLAAPVVALTFDDGYRSFHDEALPILAAHSYPSSLYVVPGIMDGTCGRDALPASLGPLMDWSATREVLRHGVTVGAHGMTHRKLSRLSPDEARREAVESRQTIEDRLGVAVGEFCYPFGSFDSFSGATEAMLTDLGFTTICASIAGHNTAPRDARRLKRLRISWTDDSITEIAKQCDGAYSWYALVQRAQAWRAR